MDITNQIRNFNLRESKRKLIGLQIARHKRAEINDLINKELRIKNGAINLLSVCHNEQTEERLKLELTFVDSKIKYLKDQLAELNCDWTLYKMKNSKLNSIKQNSATTSSSSASNSSTNSPTSLSSSSNNNNSNNTKLLKQAINDRQQHQQYSSNMPAYSSITLSLNSTSLSSTSSLSTSSSSRLVASHQQQHHQTPINLKQFRPLPEITITPSTDNINLPCEFIPIRNLTKNGSYSFSPSTSSSISIPTLTITSPTTETTILATNNNNGNNGNNIIITPSSVSSSNIMFTSSSSSSRATILNTNSNNNNMDSFDCYSNQNEETIHKKSADIMIYLNLKETINNLDFTKGFKNFILNHYKEEPNNYQEQIRQFNYFRESTIRLSYEPSNESIQRLFEYFNSLNLIERRFFQMSQCNNVNFTWFDCINGVESTQKSIQFEKASILFNCSTLYTQLAAICCDGNENKLDEQLIYWQKASGCLNFLNLNFSNSPSLDMSSYLLSCFVDLFLTQAYETKVKIILSNIYGSDRLNMNNRYEPKKHFVNHIHCAKICSQISENYNKLKTNLENNVSIKNYLPEIWFYLIKVKSMHYKALSHYYAAIAITTDRIESVYDNLEVQVLFDTLHDRSATAVSINSSSYNLKSNFKLSNTSSLTMRPLQTATSYFQKKIIEQQQLYDSNSLKDEKRIHLARAHMRESIVWQEEAIRQHGFCRKFSKDDYLYHLLRYYHDIALDKFMLFENASSDDFDDELFDVLPISYNLSEKLTLKPIEPNFQQFESKDFFNLIGPLKVYSSEYEISPAFTCILKKQASQQTFGITVKGDCPVRINNVDPKSHAYNVGIREGDFIIAIQDQDVRWSKHSQVVEKIRSFTNCVKLTLINIKPIPREQLPNFCDENSTLNNNQSTNGSNNENLKPSFLSKQIGKSEITPTSKKKLFSTSFNLITSNQNQSVNTDQVWSSNNTKNCDTSNQQQQQQTPKSQRLRHRFFRLPLSQLNDSPTHKQFTKSSIGPGTTNGIGSIPNVSSIHKNPSKYKLNPSFKSTTNINGPICFNEEDDEICDDREEDNQLFWQNLKSIKIPFTNTITFGRKFKKNVLKLSIFNSFSSKTTTTTSTNKTEDHQHQHQQQEQQFEETILPLTNQQLSSELNKFEDKENSTASTRLTETTTSTIIKQHSTTTTNLSFTKNKLLRKYRRNKELEIKSNQNECPNDDPSGTQLKLVSNKQNDLEKLFEKELIYKTL